MTIELRLWKFGARFFFSKNDLTKNERVVINGVIPEVLGYDDVDDIAKDHGFDSAKDLASYHSFENPRDFYLGDGWQVRLAPYKNGIVPTKSTTE